MDARIGTGRHTRARAAVALLTAASLLAGCGGGATHPAASTPSLTGSSAPSRNPATTGTRPATAAGHPSALAFAKCMRANGVPNFPDPEPGGGFVFPAVGVNGPSPAFRAAQTKCQSLMPGGGPLSPGPPPSAATMAKLRTIASCMRAHGVAQFPDPRATPPPQASVNPIKYHLITNYEGAILLFPASIDMQSPAYRQAAAACGAAFLGSPHHH